MFVHFIDFKSFLFYVYINVGMEFTFPIKVIKEMINIVRYIKLIAIIRINNIHIVSPHKLYHAKFQFKSELLRAKLKM